MRIDLAIVAFTYYITYILLIIYSLTDQDCTFRTKIGPKESANLVHVQLHDVLRKEVDRDGLVAVAGIRIVVPARQLRGRVTAEVLLVRVVERVVVLGVAPRNGHGCMFISEFKTVLKKQVQSQNSR